jgi:histone deacetylase 1/2
MIREWARMRVSQHNARLNPPAKRGLEQVNASIHSSPPKDSIINVPSHSKTFTAASGSEDILSSQIHMALVESLYVEEKRKQNGSHGSSAFSCYYVHSPEFAQAALQAPFHPQRECMVHSLICSFGLLAEGTPSSIQCLSPSAPFSQEELSLYFDSDYMEALFHPAQLSGADRSVYGLVGDCAPFKTLSTYVSYLAGSIHTLANVLIRHREQVEAGDTVAKETVPLLFFWQGGRHHAHYECASGYCFINDIALCISLLRTSRVFSSVPIMYIDLDVHHCDGVEKCVDGYKDIIVFSVHHASEGYFPGTGADYVYHNGSSPFFRMPLQAGASNTTWIESVKFALTLLRAKFLPECLLVQCGSDSLSADPLGCFNLSSEAYLSVLEFVESWELPTVLLGGGGYVPANSARLWTLLTAQAAGVEIDVNVNSNIPADNPWFESYGPSFNMNMQMDLSARKDENSAEDMWELKQVFSDAIEKYFEPLNATATAGKSRER